MLVRAGWSDVCVCVKRGGRGGEVTFFLDASHHVYNDMPNNLKSPTSRDVVPSIALLFHGKCRVR